MKMVPLHLGVVFVTGLLVTLGDATATTTDVSGSTSTGVPIPLRQADPPPGSLPPPPKQSDRVFVGRGTSFCTFKGSGPIRIIIKTRYVGETTADGRLKDPEGMVAAGVIEPTAELLIPVWDIDSWIPAHWPIRPEVDVAFINGRKLGTLRGSDSSWSENRFKVNIRDLKFPSVIGGAADNEVLIQIDTENATPNWCTAVEWASLTLKAMAPVLLVHGNNSDPQFFERRGCARGLREAHVPFVFGPQLQTAPTETNGHVLAAEFQKLVSQLGSSGIHVIAHSKGGLDSRWAFHLLRSRQPTPDFVPVVPYSLTTLSTPHQGSFLAKLKLEFEAAINNGAVEFKDFPGFAEKVTRTVPRDPATPSLTPAATASLAARTQLTAFVPTIFIAADADVNGNQEIDMDGGNREFIDLVRESVALEAVYNDGVLGPLRAAYAVDAMYRTLAEIAEVKTAPAPPRQTRAGTLQVSRLVAIPAPSRQLNDTLVSLVSGLAVDGGAWPAYSRAGYSGGSGKNHSNIASADVCRRLAQTLIEIDRQRGGLR